MSEQAIDLKGSLFTLSVLHLSENDLPQLAGALKTKIEQAPSFFYRAPIVINIDKLIDQSLDFAAIAQVITAMDLVLVGISGGSAEQKQQAKSHGLAVLNPGKSQPTQNTAESEPVVVEKIVEKVVEKTIEKPVYQPAMEVHQNIRSGQQIYAKDSDLIILGSVGNGSEVIADGNIHIYGTLRGRAIAGAKGDQNAKIYCQNLMAELVSIDGNFMMSDGLQNQIWGKPANIALSGEKIIVSELN